MSLWILCLYSHLIPELYAVLPFPLLDLNLPLNDEVECMDYSTDCADKKGLCKNEAFKEIMYTKCAKTCQVCGEIIKDDDPLYNVNIQDARHVDYETNWKYPRMDTDKSYSLENYGHSEEIRSESIEAPNINHLILRPPPSPPIKHKPRKIAVQKPCFDVAPNCFYLKSLCFNKFYLPVMQNNCRRTCGFCSMGSPSAVRQI
ncbi:unnamed protein product [Bursaphelenchus xylophilus]|uniref:(pine wood nematode) hypothetical protein n=1 Tax=Bursaphelenchus xylophilus TaxID=6326 RepID=A0A7I8X6C6_BURXY|nr:unnamed protein product [Bursaphelenchus xylophilus]CAG9123400.1 unnamed protein product [Bursaphelenchus xylophilus]